MSSLNEEHPEVVKHINSEAEVRRELVSVKAQLEKYQAVYGDPSTLPPDIQKLEAQLREKSDEVEKHKLLDAQHREVRVFLSIVAISLTNVDFCRLRPRCTQNWRDCPPPGRLSISN